MRQLGQLEAAVMQRLWSRSGPVSVRQVLEDLSIERALAYTTVMTVLNNLHSKGMVRRAKQGRAYLYSPCSTREEHTVALLEQVLADIGDRRSTLVHFVEQMRADEVDELRAALSDRTQPPT